MVADQPSGEQEQASGEEPMVAGAGGEGEASRRSGAGLGSSRGAWRSRRVTLLAAGGAGAVAVTAGLLLSGFADAAPAAPSQVSTTTSTPTSTPTSSVPTITVTGTGVVTGAPDTLTLQMGVAAKAATATGALDLSSTELASLEKAFTAAGVAADDLQTSGLDLQPNNNSNGTVITSYEADDNLTITLTDLSDAGSVIDTAAHAVGDDVRIQGLTFSITNTGPLLAKARAAAVGDAATAAKQLAAAAGASLGPIVSVSDVSEQVPTPTGASGLAFASAARASAPVPVEAGTQQVSVQVQVVYQLAG